MLKTIKALHNAGVLGLNRRNAEFILPLNERRRYPLVDNKLLTKKLAKAGGLAVPDTYGVIASEYDNHHHLTNIIDQYPDFVIKPACGSGGNGVLVISGHRSGRYRTIAGDWMSTEELHHHLSNILHGLFSLGGQSDAALIEYRVRFDPVFDEISFQGVPDIRIIVFMGVPVMSMVRLPTKLSGGKANLHQGAIGAGIDLSSGMTLTAVSKNGLTAHHPDTGNPVSGVLIPKWEELMLAAAGCYELTQLGYLGVDLVLDRDKGPLILELNARPGLAIQLANRSGLLPRLNLVRSKDVALMTISDRVNFARATFQAGSQLGSPSK